MRFLIYITLPFLLFAKTTFITPMEYASQLYENPRGIGCHLCHGDKGEGKIVASYIDKEKKKTFGGSAINKLEYAVFYKALKERKSGMPRYFLTDKEIKALYLFLHKNDTKKIKQAETVVK
jgi:mono/diheme cytochrome c family protein